jgi:outer membrane lipoprotein-sorting protein
LIFLNTSFYLYADKKQLIIDRLLKINNLTFDFEQIVHGKIEAGTCLLVFNNKLKCEYVDENQKEILINNKTLVITNKKYKKNYFYPISKSPFIKILNRSSLITLVRESNLELNDNIDLVNLDENGKKIIVFFQKDSYELIGWKIIDQLQNEIYFSLKIQSINIEIKDGLFKIPPPN